MSSPFRSTFAVLLIVMALAAAAVAPTHSTRGGSEDFVGTWITWAGTAHGGDRPVCRRLYVAEDGPATRDGAWDAPGWNGFVDGVLSAGSGRPVLRGEWRDGQIAGTFALTLRGRDAFEGTFAGAGLPGTQQWKGVRDDGAPRRPVPCRWTK